MKKLKNLEKVNKKSLNDYLLDFEPSIIDGYKNMFTDSDFKKGKTSFLLYLKSKIGMPKIGRNSLNYWLSRGWSIERAKEFRVRIKGDPEKSPMNINFWIKKGYTEEESRFKIRSQRKMNIEYWLSRGFNENDSKLKVKLFQSEQSKKINKKRLLNPEKYDDISNNQVKYWQKKGYSEEESIKMVSKRQSTFSKKICIEKYGEKKGIKIWSNRQKNWMKSMKSSKYNGVDGKSITINEKIKKYDIDRLVDSLSIKDREYFKKIFIKSKTIEDFIYNYSSKFITDEISLYRILLPIKRMKLLQVYYNTDESYIMSLIIPKIARVKSKYSYISWINNHVCRSDGEYILASFLIKNNLEYTYEKHMKIVNIGVIST